MLSKFENTVRKLAKRQCFILLVLVSPRQNTLPTSEFKDKNYRLNRLYLYHIVLTNVNDTVHSRNIVIVYNLNIL